MIILCVWKLQASELGLGHFLEYPFFLIFYSVLFGKRMFLFCIVLRLIRCMQRIQVETLRFCLRFCCKIFRCWTRTGASFLFFRIKCKHMKKCKQLLRQNIWCFFNHTRCKISRILDTEIVVAEKTLHFHLFFCISRSVLLRIILVFTFIIEVRNIFLCWNSVIETVICCQQ